jgi:thiamine kinase-like enzyme
MANLNQTDLLVGEEKRFKDLKEKIESIYGFKIINTFFPNSVSLTSRKAILETNAGTFFLKEKPLYCSDDLSLKRSFYFQDYCSDNTSCTPRIIRTKNKNFYFIMSGRKYFLSEYIKGRHFNGSKQDIVKMLNTILEISITGKKFLDQKGIPSNVKKNFASFQIATLVPELVKYASNKKEEKIAKDIQETFYRLSEEYNSIGNDNVVMAHSDCILFNFIFTDDRAYIIDFDNAKVLPRIHDFAELFVSATILNYLAAITNLKKPILLDFDKNSAKIILDFYKDKINFSEKEISLFPVICDIVWLWTLCLSVVKEDYLLEDIEDVINIINRKNHRKKILNSLIK